MAETTPKKRDVIVYLCIAVLLIMIVYYVSVGDLFQNQQNPNQRTYVHDVELTISAPNWTVTYTSENTTNITVADFLFEWANNEQIVIEKRYFSGYDSFLIEVIGNYSNGNQDRYWQYYVDGNYADKGCSAYVLTDGDVVLWSFESSNWG